MDDHQFLEWIHNRLEFSHGENPDVDYMRRLRRIIETLDGSRETQFIDVGQKAPKSTDHTKEFWATLCSCGALLHYPERLRGERVICGHCNGNIKTPGPTPEELRYRDLNEKLNQVIDTINAVEQKLRELIEDN